MIKFAGLAAIAVIASLPTVAMLSPCLAQTTPAATTVALNDPNIQYVGRWDRTSPTLFHSNWGGCYLRTRFTGTSVSINLAEGTDLVVSIDNEIFRHVDSPQGLTPLNTGPLKPGEHSLLVGAAGQNEEISLLGLSLDAGSSTLPDNVPHRPLIEFIGDSITTGTGPEHIGTVNWAWSTAEALGCDHVQIAFSARALTTGYGCAADKAAMDVQYFRLKNFNHLKDNPPADWNFSYTPDVIVINEGQNDQCGQEPPATFLRSYIGFLGKLRSRFPKAEILCFRPFSGAYGDEVHQAIDAVTAGGDSNVHFVDTTGWLTRPDFVDGTHPNWVGNLKIIGHLTPIIRPYLPAE